MRTWRKITWSPTERMTHACAVKKNGCSICSDQCVSAVISGLETLPKKHGFENFVIVKVPCVFIKVLRKNCKNQKLTFQNQSTQAKSHQTKATWYCYSYFLNQVSFQKNRFGNSATTCFIGCHLSETEDAQMHCESARRERDLTKFNLFDAWSKSWLKHMITNALWECWYISIWGVVWPN